jgi:hypothetical protein
MSVYCAISFCSIDFDGACIVCVSEVRAAALAQQISDGLQNESSASAKQRPGNDHDNNDDNDDSNDDNADGNGGDRNRSSPRLVDCAVFPFCCCARRVPRLMRVLLAVCRPNLLRGAMFRCAADWTQIVNPLILSELIRASSGASSKSSFLLFASIVVCK